MKKDLALEPLDVDLIIDGRDMTRDEREKLSAFIEKNKPDARLKKKLEALRKRLGQLPSAPTWKELIAAQDTRKEDDALHLDHSVEAALSGERDLSATDRRRIAEKIERYRTALDTDTRRAKKSRRAPMVRRTSAKVKR